MAPVSDFLLMAGLQGRGYMVEGTWISHGSINESERSAAEPQSVRPGWKGPGWTLGMSASAWKVGVARKVGASALKVGRGIGFLGGGG